MGALGAFRDDVYNADAVLTGVQVTARTDASGATLPASVLAGAKITVLEESGQAATAYTTDTAANIIAWLQQAVAVALRASIIGGGNFGTGLNPPVGVPNLFNMTYLLRITNANTGTITLTGGTGVTFVGAATLVTLTFTDFMVTVTGPAQITITRAGTALAAAQP